MKRVRNSTIVVCALIAIVSLPQASYVSGYSAPMQQTGTYDVPQISHMGMNLDGSVYIKSEPQNPVPTPGRCGQNFGWVKIPATASEAIKALAISLHISGRPVQIITSGCDGTYERVATLYSPGP